MGPLWANAGELRWLIADAALWLGYLSAGLGLVFGRTWSRMVLLVTSAVSLIVNIVTDIDPAAFWTLARAATPAGLLVGALWILARVGIPAALLVGALKLRLPESHEIETPPASGARKAASAGLDVAYACFSWIALVTCAALIFSVLGWPEPLLDTLYTWSTLAVGLAAVVLSVVHWREWPLLIMLATIFSMPVVLSVPGELLQAVVPSWLACSAAVLVFFCVRWFAFARKRAKQAQQAGKLEA
jgi:hypothetical protein